MSNDEQKLPAYPLPVPMSIHRHDIHMWSWTNEQLMQAYEYSKGLPYPLGVIINSPKQKPS